MSYIKHTLLPAVAMVGIRGCAHLGVRTRVGKVPERAPLVTAWTHDDVRLTHLLTETTPAEGSSERRKPTRHTAEDRNRKQAGPEERPEENRSAPLGDALAEHKID